MSFRSHASGSRSVPTGPTHPLSVLDHSQRANLGADLFTLFGIRPPTASSSNTKQPKPLRSSPPKSTTKPSRLLPSPVPLEVKNNSFEESTDPQTFTDSDLFITWPESRPIERRSTDSPAFAHDDDYPSGSESTFYQPDYHSPNSSPKKSVKTIKTKRRISPPTFGLFTSSTSSTQPSTLSPRSSFENFSTTSCTDHDSILSCTTTLVGSSESVVTTPAHSPKDYTTNGVRVTIESSTTVSSQAKWELDLDLKPKRGSRKNGPGAKGDRWNGNWV